MPLWTPLGSDLHGHSHALLGNSVGLRNYQTIFHNDITLFPSACSNSCLSLLTLAAWLFDDSRPREHKLYPVALICISLKTSEAEHFPICLLTVWACIRFLFFFYKKMSIQNLCFFFIFIFLRQSGRLWPQPIAKCRSGCWVSPRPCKGNVRLKVTWPLGSAGVWAFVSFGQSLRIDQINYFRRNLCFWKPY